VFAASKKKKMNQLIQKNFETKIGQIKCELLSDKSKFDSIGENKYENGESKIYQTECHQIEIIEFKSKTHQFVNDSKCWIFRITKSNDSNEQLKIKCELTNQNKDIEFDTASGEHLDAIEGYNKEWQIHIGTEDGEVMYSRAKRNDWFPERLKNKVNFYESITTYIKGNTGLETRIPQLKKSEKIHVQYLSAIDENNEESINCWTAVDELKKNLENWIGV
jgi:hypothetical protein